MNLLYLPLNIFWNCKMHDLEDLADGAIRLFLRNIQLIKCIGVLFLAIQAFNIHYETYIGDDFSMWRLIGILLDAYSLHCFVQWRNRPTFYN